MMKILPDLQPLTQNSRVDELRKHWHHACNSARADQRVESERGPGPSVTETGGALFSNLPKRFDSLLKRS